MTTRTDKRLPTSPPRAIAAIVALLVVAATVLGCGEDESTSASEAEQQAHLTVSEIESEFERSELSLVRTGSGAQAPERDGLVDVIEYQDRSNQQFELFVFTSPDDAQRALPSLVAEAKDQHGDDATAVPAANTVAVFRGRPSSIEAYRVAAEVMSRLGAACIRGSDAEERLRQLCFGA